VVEKTMEKLRLPNRSKFSMRLHVLALIAIVVVSLVVGGLAQRYVPALNPKSANCIPQEDFQFFLNDANVVQADYKKCVSDLWALSFACKIGNSAQPVANTTTPINASKPKNTNASMIN
jgi:hypothetical protein